MAGLLQLTPGAMFAGAFRVVQPLSEGGMGAVYVVEQVSTGTQRALKIMHPQLVADERMRQRFVQEAKVGALVDSDHVVQVLDAGVDAQSGTPWLTMELLKGETLTRAIERTGPFDFATARDVFSQICHAIGAAHDVGLIHRDLKPDNIFLAASRRTGASFLAKVLDFGIAKLMADAQTTGAQQTAAIGTPLWMAPEQTDATAAITPACDVWALGLIAFFTLTGRVYWRAANVPEASAAALLREIVLDSIEPASARAAFLATGRTLPTGFDDWFSRCVAREASDRFPNARAAGVAFDALAMPPGRDHAASSSGISSGNPSANSSANSSPMTSAPTTPELSSQHPMVSAPTALANVAASLGPAGTLASPRAAPVAGRAPAAPAIHASAPLPSYTEYAGQTAPTGARPNDDASVDEEAAIDPRSTSPKNLFLGLAVITVAMIGITWAMVDHGNATPTTPAGPAPTATTTTTTIASHVEPSIVVCPSGMLYVRGGAVLAPSGANETAPGVCVDATEVTVEAYEQCVARKACVEPGPIAGDVACNAGRKERARHPINCVTFDDANAYCGAMGKRLPTTLEWIRASHGGDRETPFPWGDSASGSEACASIGERRDGLGTCEVGGHTMGSSGLGVQDLAGNVAEWSDDPASGKHYVGGGSWRDAELGFGRDAVGHLMTPLSQVKADQRSSSIGFRCAATPPPR